MATSSGNKSKAKFLFIGGGVVAAVALVVFFQNYPPKPTDATGTIGAADRYHAEQITSADVKVSPDAITNWMQSDDFDKIVKDPEARALFTNEAVLRTFTDDARRMVALSDDARKSVQIADEARAKMVATDDARSQVQIVGSVPDSPRGGDFSKVQIANEAVRMQALSDDARRLQILADDARKSFQIADEAAKLAMVDDARTKVQIADDARRIQILSDDARRMQALADDARKIQILADDARAKLIAADDARKMVAADEARKMVGTDDARKSVQIADEARKMVALADDARAKMIAADDARRIQILSDDARKVLSNEALLNGLRNQAFCQALADGAVRNALVGQARKMVAIDNAD